MQVLTSVSEFQDAYGTRQNDNAGALTSGFLTLRVEVTDCRPNNEPKDPCRIVKPAKAEVGKRTMRIAQIAPLAESVPPKLYGGTERVVSWLTDELVGLGHDVTLFASGDSRTRAKLVPVCPRALRLSRPRSDPAAVCAALLEAVAEKAGSTSSIPILTGCTYRSCAGCVHRLSLPCTAGSICRICR